MDVLTFPLFLEHKSVSEHYLHYLTGLRTAGAHPGRQGARICLGGPLPPTPGACPRGHRRVYIYLSIYLSFLSNLSAYLSICSIYASINVFIYVYIYI